jgi:hypothetical protein
VRKTPATLESATTEYLSHLQISSRDLTAHNAPPRPWFSILLATSVLVIHTTNEKPRTPSLRPPSNGRSFWSFAMRRISPDLKEDLATVLWRDMMCQSCCRPILALSGNRGWRMFQSSSSATAANALILGSYSPLRIFRNQKMVWVTSYASADGDRCRSVPMIESQIVAGMRSNLNRATRRTVATTLLIDHFRLRKSATCSHYLHDEP